MRSVANNQNLKNPIVNQNNTGHSRNYQNQFGISSKTHNESMIYHNDSSISGSFNNGMGQAVRGGQGISSSGSNRPVTSSYSNNNASKLQSKQKKQVQNTTIGLDSSMMRQGV